MSEEAAFLDAIRADPDDAAARLIYADWLSEQGDESRAAHGEFIRTQIARDSADEWSSEWYALWQRERDLLKRFSSVWKAPLESRGASVLQWSGGLPSRLSFSPDVYVQRGKLIAELAPGWRALHLSAGGAGFARALRAPLPPNVVDVELHGPRPAPREVETFAASPWLEQAERLGLPGARLGLELTPLLVAASRKAKPLTALNIAHNAIDASVAEEFAQHRVFESLTELNLSDNRLGDGVAPLLAACRPGVLRTLHLHGVNSSFNYNRFQPLDVAGLIASPVLARLDALTFSDNTLLGANAMFLDACRQSTLRRLDLRQTTLAGKDFDAVQAATNAGHEWTLTALIMSDVGLAQRGAGWLPEQTILRRVRLLDVARNDLLDAGAVALADGEHLGELRAINVAHNRVSATGSAALRSSSRLPHLVKVVTQNEDRAPFFD